ncbi:MAG: hypothetical protein KGQ37_05355 [Hyphomicrobiales bacterium]|nr:hypothetical protein [Hyphomicrobiales bacterium]
MSAEAGANRPPHHHPLQNRVDPFGALHAVSFRGSMMGNRGGRFHHPAQDLGTRHWASRQWLICLCDFKDRRREVWGRGYTELFFLDEITALAAGHRPCFECRRDAARAFCAAVGVTSAPALDELLHRQRLQEGRKRSFAAPWQSLPDGAMFAIGTQAYALAQRRALPWSFAGYGPAARLPLNLEVTVLTPPSTVLALAAGYRPQNAPDAGLPH